MLDDKGYVGASTPVVSGGSGLFGLLGILFIGLKLGNVISWSWLWVLAPFWIPWCLLVAFFVVLLFIVLIAAWRAN